MQHKNLSLKKRTHYFVAFPHLLTVHFKYISLRLFHLYHNLLITRIRALLCIPACFTEVIVQHDNKYKTLGKLSNNMQI